MTENTGLIARIASWLPFGAADAAAKEAKDYTIAPRKDSIRFYAPEGGFTCQHCGAFDESAYREYIRQAIRLRTGEAIIC